MFRSFFPEPKLFFSSTVLWLAIAVLIWFTVGEPVRAAIGIDKFLVAPVCAVEAPPAAGDNAAAPADQAAPSTPASTESAAPAAATAPTNCLAPGTFLDGSRLWLYQYVLMTALLFCAFWYAYKRNEWYWWSVVGSTVILLTIFFNVQIDAWLNDWYGSFYDLLQKALGTPNSVDPATFYGEISTVAFILVPNIIALVLLAFFTSHYVFRWRKAMNSYYMKYWADIRTTEGAAQRVQEDTMRFASIVEGLGTDFFSSMITLSVFLPLLWSLSQHVTELPLIGPVSGSLVWVALVSAAFGTVLLAAVGVKLPGLNFENQRVEAAYRKELVYGEDFADRAEPMTARELFANVQKNYYRIYWHYTYFNVARYAYLQGASFVPILAMGPSILTGALTLGLFQQINQAFGQVSASFRFLASSWTTIIELLSVHKRLRLFESYIPKEQAPIKETVTGMA